MNAHRYAVTCSVDGKVVKFFSIVANDEAGAIAKAKDKSKAVPSHAVFEACDVTSITLKDVLLIP